MGSKMKTKKVKRNYDKSKKNIWIIPIVSRGGKYYLVNQELDYIELRTNTWFIWGNHQAEIVITVNK